MVAWGGAGEDSRWEKGRDHSTGTRLLTREGICLQIGLPDKQRVLF